LEVKSPRNSDLISKKGAALSALVEKLMGTQKHAMSIKPKVGGFPVLAEVLRQSGVKMNRWSLPSCQSIFFMHEGSVVQQGTPLVSGTLEIPKFNRDSLIAAIRADQEGRSTFPEFLQAAWKSGVIGYDADFVARTVAYYGANGETYLEAYPAVEI
jgi:uncharacterized protein YbcV (DUF1398 family)